MEPPEVSAIISDIFKTSIPVYSRKFAQAEKKALTDLSNKIEFYFKAFPVFYKDTVLSSEAAIDDDYSFVVLSNGMALLKDRRTNAIVYSAFISLITQAEMPPDALQVDTMRITKMMLCYIAYAIPEDQK